MTTTAVQTFSGVQRTSFADRDAAKSDQVPTYKAKVGTIDRISLVSKDRIEAPALAVARVHSDFSDDPAKKGLGYILCKSTFKRQGDMEVPDTVATCCKLMGESKKRCAAMIIKYASTSNGQPSKPVSFQPLVWLFPPDKFENLFTIHDEFAERNEAGDITVSGLNKVDLIISCEDEKFQKIKIVPSPQCVQNHPSFAESFGATLSEWEKSVSTRLDRILGREISDEILVQTFGAGSGGVAVTTVAPMTAPKEIDDLFK